MPTIQKPAPRSSQLGTPRTNLHSCVDYTCCVQLSSRPPCAAGRGDEWTLRGSCRSRRTFAKHAFELESCVVNLPIGKLVWNGPFGVPYSTSLAMCSCSMGHVDSVVARASGRRSCVRGSVVSRDGLSAGGFMSPLGHESTRPLQVRTMRHERLGVVEGKQANAAFPSSFTSRTRAETYD